MNGTVRPFKCKTCAKVFTRQENLKRHEQTHHKKSSGPSFQCPQCSASFLRSDLRKRHIRNCHPLTELSQSSVSALQWDSLENQLPLPNVEGTSPLELNNRFPPQNEAIPNISLPLFEMGNDAEGFSFAKESLCSDSYFTHFHSALPVIHKPSFDPTTSPEPLLKAIAAIGALYTVPGERIGQSRARFDSGFQALESYVKNDRTRFQDPWVIPAYLLLQTFGMYCCDDQLFLKAQNIHRNLVDVVRELQMTHDGQISRSDTDSMDENLGRSDLDDASTPLDVKWRSFIHSELRKRTIYSLYLLDSQFAIICNVRPLMSALEIKYDLPCSDNLWDAPTAAEWDALRHQQFSSFNDQDDEGGFGGGRPSQGTFYESTQYLLQHGSRRMSSSLRLLWSSPFTALILVTQLQMMSRDLTHANCLLERPMGSQTHLSVLLENQYGQIAQALRNILDLTPRGQLYNRPEMPLETATSTSHAPLWHSFWIMWYYTSITLTHPDSLLVTGTVESNLPAAIATAGHLARPRIKKNRDIYEDRDVFRILNDLERAIPEIDIRPSNGFSEYTEHPFTTFLGFKICLVGWRVVRLMVGKASDDSRSQDRSNSPPSSIYQCSPAEYVLRSIRSCTQNEKPDGHDSGSFESYETDYLQWAARTFAHRQSWPVGKWQSAIIEESLGTFSITHSLPLMVPSPSQIPMPQGDLQLATELGLADLGMGDQVWMGSEMG